MTPSKGETPDIGTSYDDATRAMDALRRLVGALRSASRTASVEVGITGAQLFVLQQLALEPKQSVNALAARTSTRQNSVSDVVGRLVARGLVTRLPAADDARRAVVSLTPAGRAIVRKAPATMPATLIAAFRILPEDQQVQLADALERWTDVAGLSDVAPTMFFERSSKKSASPRTQKPPRRSR